MATLRRPFPRALTAMLCIALSIVFAGAATTAVGDALQHQLEPDHAGAHAPLSVTVADHDDHHAGAAHEAPSDGGDGQGHGPTHHHHGDNAFANAVEASSVTLTAGPSRLSSPWRDDLIAGPPPGAPERPPKPHALRI